MLSFKHSYMQWASGADGLIPDASIAPAAHVPSLADAAAKIGAPDPALLKETVFAGEHQAQMK